MWSNPNFHGIKRNTISPTQMNRETPQNDRCQSGTVSFRRVRNLRPTRSSYGVFPSSPGRNQKIVAAACDTSQANLSCVSGIRLPRPISVLCLKVRIFALSSLTAHFASPFPGLCSLLTCSCTDSSGTSDTGPSHQCRGWLHCCT